MFDFAKFNPAIAEGEAYSDFMIKGNIFVKLNHLRKAGDKMEGHDHPFTHITLIIGTVDKYAEGKVVRIVGFMLDETKAGIEHEYVAVDGPAIVCCMHAIRNGDGEYDVASPDITARQGLELMAEFSLANSQS